MYFEDLPVHPLRLIFHLSGSPSFEREIKPREQGSCQWPEWWQIQTAEKPTYFANAIFFLPHIEQYLGSETTSLNHHVHARSPTEKAGGKPPALFGRWPLVNYHDATSRWECISHPMGRSPLFYGVKENELVVSSSIQEICLALDLWDADRDMIAEYLSSGSVYSLELSRTFVEGIRQVPAGGKLIYERGGFKIEEGGITKIGPPKKYLSGFHEAIPVIRGALNESVSAAIHGHQTVGCLFSGGVDSCAIAATSILLEPTLGHRTILLNVGSGLGTKEEKFLRQEFCDFTGRESESVELDPQQDIYGTLRAMNKIANFPVGCTFSGIFETIAYRARQLGCTILLSGDGGDEIFGHSPFTIFDLNLQDTKKFIEGLAIKRLKNGSKTTYLMDLLAIAALRGLPKLRFLNCYSALNEWIAGTISPYRYEIEPQAALLGPFYEECSSFSSRIFFKLCERLSAGWALTDYWHFRQALRVPSYEPQFEYMQLTSPPLSLSAASPMMTLPIFEANCALPVNERFGLGSSTGKTLLRYSAADRLPTSVAFHRKIGSSDDFILNQTLLKQWGQILESLTSRSLRRLGIFPAPEILHPQWLLQNKSVNWFRVLMLSTWLEELELFRVNRANRTP